MKKNEGAFGRLILTLCLPVFLASCVTTIEQLNLKPIYTPFDGEAASEVEKFYSLLEPRVSDFNASAASYNTALVATYGWGVANAVGTLAVSGLTKGLNDSGNTRAATDVALWGGISLAISSGTMTVVGLTGQRDEKANILRMKYQYLKNIVAAFNLISPDLISQPSGSNNEYQTKRQIAIQKLRGLSLSIQNGLLQPDPFGKEE